MRVLVATVGFAALALCACGRVDSWLTLEGKAAAVPASKIERAETPGVVALTPERPVPASIPTPIDVALDRVRHALHVAPDDAEQLPTPSDTRDAGPVIVATAKETTVYARPSLKAPKLGYLRAGAVVARNENPAGYDGCREGFYEIAPEGYVCVGAGASLDAQHELARASLRRADRTAPMPYVYGVAPAGAPLYSRVPSLDEERTAEPGLDPKKPGSTASFDGLPLDPVPWFLAGGAPSIGTNGFRFSKRASLLSVSIARSGFSFLSLFESAGRKFGLTSDMAIVPLDRFTRVRPSQFRGLPLTDGATLPVVFIRTKAAVLYSGDPTKAGLHFDRRLEFREVVPITGKRVQSGELAYLETTSGGFIVDKDLLRVDPRPALPSWAVSSRTWIDVSIDRQALVAYQGPRPVFVTLVSTGIDGKGDPETTHSTIQGEFLIHTKHVAVTMDNDEAGDEFDLRDVPYVEYFKDGYALHAAYWHDGFGTPRSHGCVNLSPLDARWLFAWTEPSVPEAWHGAMSTHGTLVSIHP